MAIMESVLWNRLSALAVDSTYVFRRKDSTPEERRAEIAGLQQLTPRQSQTFPVFPKQSDSRAGSCVRTIGQPGKTGNVARRAVIRYTVSVRFLRIFKHGG